MSVVNNKGVTLLQSMGDNSLQRITYYEQTSHWQSGDQWIHVFSKPHICLKASGGYYDNL